MKRILALDGGGIRGVFTLEVLVKIEELLREHYAKEDPEKARTFVLRDHFDFLAGTSTGAIIATCLCWGMPVEQVRDLYLREGRKMFEKVSWRTPTAKLAALYDPKPISQFLQKVFVEKDGKLATARQRPPARMAKRKISSWSWCATTPRDRRGPSPTIPTPSTTIPPVPTATVRFLFGNWCAPAPRRPCFFPPEIAKLGDTTYEFVDGSITPYSNPALIAALTAILPGYRVNWTPGPENIRLVSVGTIAFSSEVPIGDPRVGLGIMATKIPTAVLQTTAALMQSIGWQQDYLCRCLGDCIFAEKLDPQTMSGEKLDTEVGDLLCSNPAGAPPAGRSWFSYVRYNRTFRKKEMLKILEDDPRLKRIDAVDAIPASAISEKNTPKKM